MKITILNGSPAADKLDAYLKQLNASLCVAGHSPHQIDLRAIDLRYCIGCWGCWVKTPGQCTSRDASLEMDRAIINADFVLWAAPLKMGFPSELLKKGLDKHLPLIHPYMVVDHGEAHHLKRYPHYPRVGLLLEKEASTDDADLQIVQDIHCRTALNLKTRLEFLQTTDTPIGEIITPITSQQAKPLPLPKHFLPTVGVPISPPARLTFFNGSPRGSKGNTPLMLGEIGKGFGSAVETHHLVRMKETQQMAASFANAECAILGFPLYTDAMPAMVKQFIEALEPFVGRTNNPPLGFLVQSGFPEGLHSRYIERYLEKLATRLGSAYLGTVVKGNGEATRLMPAEANRELFAHLQALGAGLAGGQPFASTHLQSIAKPESFPAILAPVFQIFVRLPIAHSYFDGMLKQNNAYAQRFARPFTESPGQKTPDLVP